MLCRILIQLFLMLFPWSVRRAGLKAILKYEIDSSARIGFSLMGGRVLKMGKRCRIGHLNYFRRIDSVVLEDDSDIGNLNWFTGGAQIGEGALLLMKEHSAITSRHYFDVQANIQVGRYSTIAGVRSTFLTHEIDLSIPKQGAAPIVIGDYCFLSSNLVVLSGIAIASHSVVAAGAVVSKSLNEEWMLYAGVPARPVKRLEVNLGYFSRERGYVE